MQKSCRGRRNLQNFYIICGKTALRCKDVKENQAHRSPSVPARRERNEERGGDEKVIPEMEETDRQIGCKKSSSGRLRTFFMRGNIEQDEIGVCNSHVN